MTKECPNCHSTVDESADKCPQCGYDFSAATVPAKVSAAPVQDAAAVAAAQLQALAQAPVQAQLAVDGVPMDQPEPYTPETVPEYSIAFRVVSILTYIMGFILGIILGNTYLTVKGTVQAAGAYAYPSEATFNSELMVYVWILFAVIGTIFLAISCHFRHQEEIIFRMDTLIKK